MAETPLPFAGGDVGPSDTIAKTAIWVIVPLAIALLSWHTLALEPRPGLEYSWHAALHMALHDRITFGDHLIFTVRSIGLPERADALV